MYSPHEDHDLPILVFISFRFRIVVDLLLVCFEYIVTELRGTRVPLRTLSAACLEATLNSEACAEKQHQHHP
ncbi:unnamed protein product [Notodromas monacha]|uniref:Uncharacterized protein n=1 Tax=Notodromas monacha TaxID=399045 RepID=A0A7R9BU23_9CRUS|nr:unnamed protein product [Notodromas monacha]CAG0921741.1 unnamed protein product [Notodromas monacha]